MNTLFVSASNQLGESESGVMAALVGAPAVVIGGLAPWRWPGCGCGGFRAAQRSTPRHERRVGLARYRLIGGCHDMGLLRQETHISRFACCDLFVRFVQNVRSKHHAHHYRQRSQAGIRRCHRSREPVIIQRQKRDVVVVMSVDEYERLVHLNVAEFQRFSDRVGAKAQEAGMTEDVLRELLDRED